MTTRDDLLLWLSRVVIEQHLGIQIVWCLREAHLSAQNTRHELQFWNGLSEVFVNLKLKNQQSRSHISNVRGLLKGLHSFSFSHITPLYQTSCFLHRYQVMSIVRQDISYDYLQYVIAIDNLIITQKLTRLSAMIAVLYDTCKHILFPISIYYILKAL